jgi:hypothetical protein
MVEEAVFEMSEILIQTGTAGCQMMLLCGNFCVHQSESCGGDVVPAASLLPLPFLDIYQRL